MRLMLPGSLRRLAARIGPRLGFVNGQDYLHYIARERVLRDARRLGLLKSANAPKPKPRRAASPLRGVTSLTRGRAPRVATSRKGRK